MKYEKNAGLQNCSFQYDLLILSDIVSDKTYISFLISKNTIKILKFHYFHKICDIRKKFCDGKLLAKWTLQILNKSFFDKMYILCFCFKYWKSKIPFFKQKMWDTK